MRNFFSNMVRLNLGKIPSVFSSRMRYSSTKTIKSKVLLSKSSFLAKSTGMTKNKALSTILLNENLKPVSLESMKKAYDLLEKSGYAKSVATFPDLLSIPSNILRNRILLFKEWSFNDDKIPWLLTNFDFLPIKQLSTLKNFGILPKDANVIDNFCLMCKLPVEEHNIQIDDWNTFKDVYYKFYVYFLKHQLDLDEADAVKTLRPIRWTSFRILQYNIQILRHIFGFGYHEFLDKKHLLHADPENIHALLKLMKENTGRDTIKNNPKLGLLPEETVIRNYQILQDHNVPEEAPCFSKLLAIKSDVNLFRLTKVLETYQLQSYVNHPRFLTLVNRAHIAAERLNILNNLNMKCYTLNQLSCPDDVFVRHIADGVDKVQCRDMVAYIMHEIPYTKLEVRAQLKKHPFVGYIPVHVVRETMKLLKDMDFSPEDIFNSLSIVLYDWRIVENALVNLVPNLLKSLDYVDDLSAVNKKTILALAFYCIEKEHDFSGSGVWMTVQESENANLFIDQE